MSAWSAFKQAMKSEAKPWHVLDPSKHVSEEVSNKRYEICLQCPELTEHTKQCKKCGCFMALKTKIEHAACPLNKW